MSCLWNLPGFWNVVELRPQVKDCIQGFAGLSLRVTLTVLNWFLLNDLKRYWPYFWYLNTQLAWYKKRLGHVVWSFVSEILSPTKLHNFFLFWLNWILVSQLRSPKKWVSHSVHHFVNMFWRAEDLGFMWAQFNFFKFYILFCINKPQIKKKYFFGEEHIFYWKSLKNTIFRTTTEELLLLQKMWYLCCDLGLKITPTLSALSRDLQYFGDVEQVFLPSEFQVCLIWYMFTEN